MPLFTLGRKLQVDCWCVTTNVDFSVIMNLSRTVLALMRAINCNRSLVAENCKPCKTVQNIISHSYVNNSVQFQYDVN